MGDSLGMIVLGGFLGAIVSVSIMFIFYLLHVPKSQPQIGHSRQEENTHLQDKGTVETAANTDQINGEDDSLLKRPSGHTEYSTEDTKDGEVAVPYNENFSTEGLWGWFTWRQLWAFTGPGWLLTLAYLDPGNIESDLQLGALSGYSLFWVLLVVHILAFFLQMLAARIGLVSGRSLSRVCREKYEKTPRLILWIMAELAVIGSDIQEVIGSAIAIQILSDGRIPLVVGVIITVIDCFIFLLLEAWSIRYLEGAFAFLVLLMAITFATVFFYDRPPAGPLFLGLLPQMRKQKYILTAVATVGAVIMPHNLFLHSSLVLSRKVPREDKKCVQVAIYYNMIEIGIALFVAFGINFFIVGVFAHSFFDDGGKNKTGLSDCETDKIGLSTAGKCLAKYYGQDAIAKVWALGLLASGQASTMSGTYAGQKIMEGFLNVPIKPWQRVTITRAIALGPALFASLSLESNALDTMNQWLNILQSLQLPFALVPVVLLSSSQEIMGYFANSRQHLIIYIFVAVVVILFNATLVAVNLYTNVILAFFSSLLGVLYLFFLYMLSFGKFEVQQNKSRTRRNYVSIELTEDVPMADG